MSVSTHVLDTSRGRPAEGMRVVLESAAADGGWVPLGATATGSGRETPVPIIVSMNERLN